MGRQDEIVAERIKKLHALRKLKINPYPNTFDVQDSSRALHEKYAKLKNEAYAKGTVKIAGRLTSVRDLGKIAFGTLYDGAGAIQVVLQEKETPEKVREFFKEFVDMGDFVGVTGSVFRTKRGELSVMVEKLELLTKSLLPLPDKFHGIVDDEERLRKRYLEIITNPETREMFVRKSKFWETMRSFLKERGFLEVETPVLENSAGGASATPFATHHNALNLEVYLRISMGELWQKKCMVAGYPKTFEIGRQFRNEGMDAEHLQDYTQMEFYWGYANYEMGMSLVEALYKTLAKEVYGKTKFSYGEHEFDIGKKWSVIDYADTIKKELKIDIFNATKQEMEKKLRELKQEFAPALERGRLMDLLWKVCRKKISGPVFLTGQPVEVSPLAKRNPEDSRKVEQFQIILAGTEMGNGYSELNDPFDQEARFQEQRKMKEAGDSEAQEHDESFVEALKYGMPPTCGFGVSERLFSLFENKPIRECVLFPLMRPSQPEQKDKDRL
ncbi:MAG: lysine--tRNA ligase [Nanoarchaeota archaeon]